MRQYLYRIRPTRVAMLREGLTEEEAAIIREHFAYLRDLTSKGVVFMAGRTLHTDETSFGIVVFRAESDDAATAIMEADPAVRHHVMSAELFPYRVALWSHASPLAD